ncbi:MAG: serine/threonine-protein kinase [Pyrinomonadaceae bacterium MAG19_C2-C3]|nr:serine/threonine-protein kinase [Pyrinomonadaceae bacterium MAG19_C2-C3]
MSPERWREVEAVLQAALDCPPPERAVFLDVACAGDDDLKREAVSLIHALTEAGDFMEQPAMAHDARVLFAAQRGLDAGSRVGRYEIVRCLGVGGMGEVYLAHDAGLRRAVALKILPAYFVLDDNRLRRFYREARAASALNHPNILTIHEVGEADDVHFIATEFIDGRTLRELVDGAIDDESLDLKDILDIAIHVASALAAAHEAGIVHRDIKPENIMRRTDRIVKVLDFGIAKLTAHAPPQFSTQVSNDVSNEASTIINPQTGAGVRLGTISYMSPEQARGQIVDHRTDIWSFGVVLYELLARRHPFAAATQIETLVGILEHEPPSLIISTAGESPASNVSEHLRRITAKMLRKDALQRYESASPLLDDLNAVKEELELAAMLEKQAASKTASPSENMEQVAASLHVQPLNEKNPALRSFVSFAFIAAALVLVVAAGAILYQGFIAPRSVNVSNINAAKLYRRMSEREQLAFIREQEQRISQMMGDRRRHTLDEDALRSIKRVVDRYVARIGSMSDEHGNEDLRVIYARALPYLPLISRSFAERKVPVVVGIYLPMIEAEYKTCFENSIGAKGMFQFLPQTAKLYGVAHDEMCDVEKMTPAAARYIADRMAELGDDAESMTLVLLSYNRGAEWVRDTLRRLRETGSYERNFWTLYAHRTELDEIFRQENAQYVPLFFAAAIIGENPAAFELQTPPLSSSTQ